MTVKAAYFSEDICLRLPGSQTQFHRMTLHPAVNYASKDSGKTVAKPIRSCACRSLRRLWVCLTLASFALGTSAAHGQAAYTAKRAGDLQAGLGFSYARSDYGQPPSLRGGTFYASFDFKPHFGVEVDNHQLNAPSASTPANQTDYSKVYNRDYEVGGRYVRHYGILNPYARLMYGRGVFNYPSDVANLAYNMGVIGVGVDVNVTQRINVRADYEYQQWYSFHGQVFNSTSSTLSPQGVTIGAAYHFQ